MATRITTPALRFSSPDITEPVKIIKRDRAMRMVGALGSLGLMMAGLLAFPYLSFRETFDPGPAESAYTYNPAPDSLDQDLVPAPDMNPPATDQAGPPTAPDQNPAQPGTDPTTPQPAPQE